MSSRVLSGNGAAHSGMPPTETARYIADLSNEMALLAQGAGLEVVAYLLDMARAEAEQNAETEDLSGS